MANQVDNAILAYVSKIEDDLGSLNDMIEAATLALNKASSEADKLLGDIVRTYIVRMRIERAQLIVKLDSIRTELDFYGEDE